MLSWLIIVQKIFTEINVLLNFLKKEKAVLRDLAYVLIWFYDRHSSQYCRRFSNIFQILLIFSSSLDKIGGFWTMLRCLS